MNKVLLVAPFLTDEPAALTVPLNFLYLATAVHKFEPSSKVDILDLILEYFEQAKRGKPKLDLLEFQKNAVSEHINKNGKYDIVGLTGLCDCFFYTILLAEHIKKNFNSTVVIGGPHATFIAREILEEYDFVDYVISYEGSGPFVKFCRSFSGGKIHSPEKILNLTYRDAGKIIENRSENHHYILDPSFRLDFGLLPIKKYLEHNRSMQFPILVGSGCPYSCTFCSTTLMWEKRYLVRDVKSVAEEIKEISQKHGVKKFSFVHDNLLFSKDYALALSSEIAKQNISWSCSGRLDNVLAIKDIFPKLKSAGLSGVFMGVESGSPRIQKAIRKRLKPIRSYEAFKLLQENGIESVFSFIIGFPEETYSDLNKTIRLAFRLKTLGAKRVNLHNIIPTPGTDIYKYSTLVKKTRYNDSNYYAPPYYDNETVRKTIDHSPKIFGSHRFVKLEALDRDYNFYYIGMSLDSLLVDFPKSFDFVFHSLGINPTSMFDIFQHKNNLKLIKQYLKKTLNKLKFDIFCEFIEYESKINKLIAMKDEDEFENVKNIVDSKKSLVENKDKLLIKIRRRTDLMHSHVGLDYYIVSSMRKRKVKKRGPQYLLLAGIGDSVDSFTIKEHLFEMFKFMKKRSCGCVCEVFDRFGSDAKTLNLFYALIENDIVRCYL